jgi:hypothetical protein
MESSMYVPSQQLNEVAYIEEYVCEAGFDLSMVLHNIVYERNPIEYTPSYEAAKQRYKMTVRMLVVLKQCAVTNLNQSEKYRLKPSVVFMYLYHEHYMHFLMYILHHNFHTLRPN